LSPQKLPIQSKDDEGGEKNEADVDALPSTNGEKEVEPSVGADSGSSSVLPAEVVSASTGTPMSAMPSKPPAFTPSIAKTLQMEKAKVKAPPLPAGLTVAELKNRLTGKKKIK
jgi:DNA-3-methyladenine glycosylase II